LAESLLALHAVLTASAYGYQHPAQQARAVLPAPKGPLKT